MKMGGGLLLDRRAIRPLEFKPETPATFQPPRRLGNWEYFLKSENQYQNPWCAAFGMCAILQAGVWRILGYPVQFNEERCYRTAKAIDGNAEDGTYLESVIEAANRVNLAESDIPQSIVTGQKTYEANDIPWLLHQCGAILIGMNISEGWLKPRAEDSLIRHDGADLGGHCVVVNWYNLDDDGGRVGGPNWWGDGGEWWTMTLADFHKEFTYGFGIKVELGT